MNKQEHEALRLTREQRLEAILRELNDHLSFGDAPSEMLDRVDAILAEPAAFGFDYSIQTRTATGTAQAEPAPAQDGREAIHLAFEHKLREVNLRAYGEHRGDWRTLTREEMADVVVELLTTRPAQAEQQPLIYINPMVIDELEGKRKASPGGLTWSRKALAHWTFPLYAAPIAQTAPQPAEQPAPDVKLKPDDLIVQHWSSKPRAQWDSSQARGIKITHVPSRITVTCETEGSVHANKEKALRVLEARLAGWREPEQSGLVEALEEIAAGEKTVWCGDHFEVENDRAIDYPGIAKAALEAYRAALSAQGQSNGNL